MNSVLKSKNNKVFYWLTILYYFIDIYFTRWYSAPFLIALFHTKFRLDIISILGVLSIFHLVLIVAMLPAVFIYFKKHIQAAKLIAIYAITAILFYGLICYGNIRGGGALEKDYIGYFMIAIAMTFFGFFIFSFAIRNLKIPPSA